MDRAPDIHKPSRALDAGSRTEIPMIEILPAPDHVLAVRFTGTLDATDEDRLIRAVEEKLAKHRRIGVYADATGFTDMTAEALAKDVRYNLSKIGEWDRFPRADLVTEQRWLRTLVGALDPIFPQFEARSFEPGDEAQAMAFASEIPVRS